MQAIRQFVFAGAVVAALIPSSHAQVSLTLLNYGPGQSWNVNSTDGTRTASDNSIAAMQTVTVVPGLFGQTTFEVFCVELGQHTAALGSPQAGYVLLPLAQADSGISSAQTMETYAGISSAGIGAAAAERISRLYGRIFGTDLNLSRTLTNDTLKAAFQLAVWEVSHDDDFSLRNPGGLTQGFFASGSQVGIYDDAIVQANSWLAELQANYATTEGMALAVFHHVDRQDLIVPIPEPTAYASVLGAVVAVAVLRPRMRRGYR